MFLDISALSILALQVAKTTARLSWLGDASGAQLGSFGGLNFRFLQLDLLLFLLMLFFALPKNLHEFVVDLVSRALGYMKGQRKDIKRVAVDRLVVLWHVEEKSEFVGQVVISLHFCVNSPLVWQISLNKACRIVFVASVLVGLIAPLLAEYRPTNRCSSRGTHGSRVLRQLV